MADFLRLTILTPEKQFYKGEVKIIKSNNLKGSFEILAKHMPLVTILVPSITEFTDVNGKKYKAFTSSGVLRVKENEIIFLCDACEWPEEVDKKRAEEARGRAQKRLKEERIVDTARAESALLRAMTRLRITSP